MGHVLKDGRRHDRQRVQLFGSAYDRLVERGYREVARYRDGFFQWAVLEAELEPHDTVPDAYQVKGD